MRKYIPAMDTSAEIEALKEKIRKEEGSYKDYRTLVDAYEKNRKFEEGHEFFQSLFQSHHDNTLALYGSGLIDLKGNFFEQAQKTFQKALKQNPEAPEGYKGLSESYLMMQDLPKAIDYATRAMELAKGRKDTQMEADILGNLAQMYYLDKQYNKALIFQDHALSQHVELDSTKDVIIDKATMARIYSAMGKYEEAQQFFVEAINLAETSKEYAIKARIHGFWAKHYQDYGDNTNFMVQLNAGKITLQHMGAEIPGQE